MQLLGVITPSAVTPQATSETESTQRREISGQGQTYEQAYQDVSEKVPGGWRLLHVRRGD